MQERMIKIDEEREALKIEKQKYENYFQAKKEKEILNNHIKFEGKCFFEKGLSTINEHKYIKAFKVLKVKQNGSYAECVALINDDIWGSYFNAIGIQEMILPLWKPDRLELMECKLKMIDMYKEVSEEEFRAMFNDYMKIIKNKYLFERTILLDDKKR